MRYALFILFILPLLCKSQPSRYRAFTMADGLPSNNVYRCVEDDKGFLWIATDAGLARFDGKRFTVFTTHDGLPDNEVIDVVKEKNGRIWANCFKQTPAYFDEANNRFINSTTDPILRLIPERNNVMYCTALKDGGVMFANDKSYIIKDGKITIYGEGPKSDTYFVIKNADGSVVKLGGAYIDKKNSRIFKLYRTIGHTYTDSAAITKAVLGDIFTYENNDHNLYMFNRARGWIYKCSNFTSKPFGFKLDSIKSPELFSSVGFTSNSFYLIGFSGKILLYDKKTLQHRFDISGNYLPNSVYKDRKGNMWVGTIDKGLLYYENNRFNAVQIPQNLNSSNFLSIAGKPDGAILAGGFYGTILEAKGSTVIIHQVPAKNNIIARQKKILVLKNDVYTFSESGMYVNYDHPLLNLLTKTRIFGKTAIVYNDSILLVGTAVGLQKFNTNTKAATLLRAFTKRVTAMASSSDGAAYIGSTDGLYKYNYTTRITTELKNKSALLKERIASICISPDNLVWVATSSQGIAVLKNDELLLRIAETDGMINNATRCITTGRPGEVWLGTSNGISRINYTLKNNRLGYKILNLTRTDGLTDNIINELVWNRDTVYAATSNGISIIPADISVRKFSIPVQLTGVSVNQRDTLQQSYYKLKYWQNNLQLQFAGVELGGHFKNFQYTIDKNATWLNLPDNTLALQLESGDHIVQVRAVDINGTVGSNILKLRFDIATPFWKSAWFWIISAIVVQVILIYFINQRHRKKKEDRLAKQIAGVQTAALEQQAFTSLMNPHFMFNALNSIQHYINLQDRQNTNRYLSDFASLIRKNFEAAQQSFIPLEQELENIRIYLGLEQMRFSDRFAYKLSVPDHIDTEDWMIPTMILQPLLENALLHGIMPSAIKGELEIDVRIENGYLLVTVMDNGIGIRNSMALHTNSEHKSRGTELIKKRIAALSNFGTGPITIKMSPLSDDEKNPGNRTVLTIPPDLYDAWLAAQRA
ncbi:histidine kinase [Mucilaginibacter mali]|uniref:Histidine kinase n=1 Tax=Mucilaginibacter mali TaxID=2740462 RepID=A0A7D4UDI0_9SPHI|nr:histidine kinase [Mucilaginibacter mali]QKJ30599.1 histidine kinase [Mucilaginibacter mali]